MCVLLQPLSQICLHTNEHIESIDFVLTINIHKNCCYCYAAAVTAAIVVEVAAAMDLSRPRREREA